MACSKYHHFNKVLKSKDNENKLAIANELYNKKDYSRAQQLFEQLYTVYKGTDKFEDLYFKDAYCFYYMGEYKSAENFFKGFLEVFPNSSKAEEVDYMQAYCFYKESPRVELDQEATQKTIGMMQVFINLHPNSPRAKEASEIIDKCRQKLETKEYRSAELYYKIGQYRAAALGYGDLLVDYPDSKMTEEYEFKMIKSYFYTANLSIPSKKEERYERVTTEYQNFADRFPDSKYLKEAADYSKQSQQLIKDIQNEQIKTTTQR
jgi:outer membrane protein assembly factor BamD